MTKPSDRAQPHYTASSAASAIDDLWQAGGHVDTVAWRLDEMVRAILDERHEATGLPQAPANGWRDQEAHEWADWSCHHCAGDGTVNTADERCRGWKWCGCAITNRVGPGLPQAEATPAGGGEDDFCDTSDWSVPKDEHGACKVERNSLQAQVAALTAELSREREQANQWLADKHDAEAKYKAIRAQWGQLEQITASKAELWADVERLEAELAKRDAVVEALRAWIAGPTGVTQPTAGDPG